MAFLLNVSKHYAMTSYETKMAWKAPKGSDGIYFNVNKLIMLHYVCYFSFGHYNIFKYLNVSPYELSIYEPVQRIV